MWSIAAVRVCGEGIEMRLSVYSDNYLETYNCRVLLDGRDVTARCHTADEEQGKVWLYKITEAGWLYVDPENPDRPAEEVLTGKVEIFMRVNGG